MPSQSKDYANQNTKYAISTEGIRQPNVNSSPQYWFTLFCLEAIIVANLRTSRRTIWCSENYAGVQKMTNYRYDSFLIITIIIIIKLWWLFNCSMIASRRLTWDTQGDNNTHRKSNPHHCTDFTRTFCFSKVFVWDWRLKEKEGDGDEFLGIIGEHRYVFYISSDRSTLCYAAAPDKIQQLVAFLLSPCQSFTKVTRPESKPNLLGRRRQPSHPTFPPSLSIMIIGKTSRRSGGARIVSWADHMEPRAERGE